MLLGFLECNLFNSLKIAHEFPWKLIMIACSLYYAFWSLCCWWLNICFFFFFFIQEKHPQRPWPKDQIWSFKSSPKFFGSPMLDAVINNTPLDRDMVHWLKHRPAIFQAMWDQWNFAWFCWRRQSHSGQTFMVHHSELPASFSVGSLYIINSKHNSRFRFFHHYCVQLVFLTFDL
jgi:hypothetical protein